MNNKKKRKLKTKKQNIYTKQNKTNKHEQKQPWNTNMKKDDKMKTGDGGGTNVQMKK